MIDLVARSQALSGDGGRIEGNSPLSGDLSAGPLLVREAVQNSWDARDDARSGPVHFRIDGWTLTSDRLNDLRTLLPVDSLDGFRTSSASETKGVLHPRIVLARSEVRVLVISDRNTVGLCGPDRSGREWKPVRHGQPLARGQQRFANFVRNQGRSSEHIGGGDGGSYGVGKTSNWEMSECGTVLIHSRTTDQRGEPVERFMGAIHGEDFYADGIAYTGRHFIGHESADGIIDPLTGEAAARAAKMLPIPGYTFRGEPTDGTSIVIVAPRLFMDWPIEMARIRDAVRWNVWPKLIPGIRDEYADPDLSVSLGWDGNDVPIPNPLRDPEIAPYAAALADCVHGRTAPEEGRDHDAICRSPKKTLGRLVFRTAGTADDNVFRTTLTASELEEAAASVPSDDAGVDTDTTVAFDTPWGQIALIRHNPLLLVGYEPIGGPDEAATEVGVFLSADDPEVEDALTRAEPPAHETWSYRNVPKDHSRDHRKTFAKRTTDEIARAKSDFLKIFRQPEEIRAGGREQDVSARLSAGLFGGFGGGGRPSRPATASSRGQKLERVSMEVVSSRQHRERTVHELTIGFHGLGQPGARRILLTATGNARDEAGSMPVDDRVSYRWADHNGELGVGSSVETTANDAAQLFLEVTVHGDLRFRPRIDMTVLDGS